MTAGLVGTAVVFGVVVNDVAAGAVVVVFGAAPAAPADVELELPKAGVIVLEVGSVVSGVGTGGNGFDRTLAISSFRPASDLL